MTKESKHKTVAELDGVCSEVLTPIVPTESKRSRLNKALRENLRKRKNQTKIRKLANSLNEKIN